MKRSCRARLAICGPAGDRDDVLAGWAALRGLVAHHPCYQVNCHLPCVIDGAASLCTKQSSISFVVQSAPKVSLKAAVSITYPITTSSHLSNHSLHVIQQQLPTTTPSIQAPALTSIPPPPPPVTCHTRSSPPFHLPHLALRLTYCVHTHATHARTHAYTHRSTQIHTEQSVGRRWNGWQTSGQPRTASLNFPSFTHKINERHQTTHRRIALET